MNPGGTQQAIPTTLLCWRHCSFPIEMTRRRRLSWGLSNYPVLSHNCKFYPIKRQLQTHPLKLHQPQAFNNCEAGRQSGLIMRYNGNLAPWHTRGSELGCGNPSDCLIIELLSSMDSVTNSPYSAQSNS